MIYYPVGFGQYDSARATQTQKFTGLSNQGATCYMNSLLQSLYMTPELRRKIYGWVYDAEKHGDRSDSIPYNLQLLFGKLQLAKSAYIETKALTTSFGWDPREAFQQHDVQEFCRVLFDALEESVCGTPDANFVNEMYEGVMVDYVKCLACGYESSRQDTFLDLSLTVRSEFDKIYNDSIEKALGNYIKPEKLCRDNQYFCSQCNAKQDARKGLKFQKFPKFLVLQLKRFDLDYTTFQRVKLNDRVTFPLLLNMNPFLKDFSEEVEQAVEPPPSKEETTTTRQTFKHTPTNIDAQDFETKVVTGYETIVEDRDKRTLAMDAVTQEKILAKETEERKAQQTTQVQEYIQEGEYVYELFSIMIHSGSAIGGHYYAYIKNFEDCRWYQFNDSVVTPINDKDIEKVFGGTSVASNSAWGWSSGFSTNAYLLMYRKVEPENVVSIADSEVPSYIQDELEALLEQDRLDNEERAKKYRQLSLKINYNKQEKLLTVQRDELLSKVKTDALELFELTVPPENARLRGYSPYNDIYQEVYSEEKTVEALGFWNYKVLAFELKETDAEWPSYNPNGITVKVNLWHDDLLSDSRTLDAKTSTPDKVVVDKKLLLQAFLEQLETLYGIPADKQVLWRKSYVSATPSCEQVNTPQFLTTAVMYARMYDGSVLYLEQETGSPSKWKELFEQESRRLTLKFNHPDHGLNSFNQPDYSYSVVLESSKTVQELREAVAQSLGLGEDEFIMRKGGKLYPELKEPSVTLLQAYLSATTLLHIERGTPAKTGEFRVSICLAAIVNASETDAGCYNFYSLFDMPASGQAPVKELKEAIVQKALDQFPSMHIDLSQTRLRERNNERLSRVLQDDLLFNRYSPYDRKELALQLLVEPESRLGDDALLVVVKHWNPATWDISAPREVIVNKHATIEEFGQAAAALFGIDAANLEAAKITSVWNFSRLDLRGADLFVKTHGNKSQLVKVPWYLNLDGALIFVKDSTQTIRELTEAERKQFSKTTSYESYPVYRPAERAMKITVKKRPEEEAEPTQTD